MYGWNGWYKTDGYIYNKENRPDDNPQDSPLTGWRIGVSEEQIKEHCLQESVEADGFIEDRTFTIKHLSGLNIHAFRMN